jgi:hypothetical protein
MDALALGILQGVMHAVIAVFELLPRFHPLTEKLLLPPPDQ